MSAPRVRIFDSEGEVIADLSEENAERLFRLARDAGVSPGEWLRRQMKSEYDAIMREN